MAQKNQMQEINTNSPRNPFGTSNNIDNTTTGSSPPKNA